MFPLLIPMAIGAVGGALIDKKKPLRGALLGGGLGAGAGALAPAGLLGGAAAAGTGTAAGAGAATAGTAAGTAAAATPAAGFGLGQPLVTGTLGASEIAGATATPTMMEGLLATATKYKPLMDAAGTGLAMSGAMSGGQGQPQMQAPEVTQTQGGAETLGALAGQGGAMATMQADAQERARRRAMRGFS